MYQKHGFTLIELLVVVLIIGILASIALPQYEKAVKKSKMANAVAVVKAFADAEELYYLANGKYTPSMEDLDISLSGGELAGNVSDTGYIRYSSGILDLLANRGYITGGTSAAIFFSAKEGFVVVYFLQNSSYPNTWLCVDESETNFCQSLGGEVFSGSVPGYAGKSAYYLPLS